MSGFLISLITPALLVCTNALQPTLFASSISNLVPSTLTLRIISSARFAIALLPPTSKVGLTVWMMTLGRIDSRAGRREDTSVMSAVW